MMPALNIVTARTDRADRTRLQMPAAGKVHT